MCGRFALHTPRSRIAGQYFNLQWPAIQVKNIGFSIGNPAFIRSGWHDHTSGYGYS